MKKLHNMSVISFKQFLVKSGLKHIAVGETILTIPQETKYLAVDVSGNLIAYEEEPCCLLEQQIWYSNA